MPEKGAETTEEVEKKIEIGEGNGSKTEEKMENGEGRERSGSGDYSVETEKKVSVGPPGTNEKMEECTLDIANLEKRTEGEKEATEENDTKDKETEASQEEENPLDPIGTKKEEEVQESSEKMNESSSKEEEEKELTPWQKKVKEANAILETPQGKLSVLIREGQASLFVNKDPEEAAEILGQACENARELYGETGDECAEVFYLYGCAMLECSKILENTVLGENMPQKEGDSDGQDEEQDDNEEEEPEVLVNKRGAKTKEIIPTLVEPKKPLQNEDTGEEISEENEEEDNMLKAAWEMFELSNMIFQRQNNEEKVAEVYMKLGEVSLESGNVAALDDMKQALNIRTKTFPEGHRIIPETHFHIGLTYSFFQMFDEAIEEFKTSKKLLTERIILLEKEDRDKAREEIKEIQDLIPDIDEKISDMVESKEEKLKAEKEKMNGEGTSESPKKEVTNISHLVKRKRKIDDVSQIVKQKRKIDDVTFELQQGMPSKHVCLDKPEAEKEVKEEAN